MSAHDDEGTHAHDIVLSFCRSAGSSRVFSGNYGMRKRYDDDRCIVTCLDWSTRPDLAEGDSWEEVYCQLAVSQALDRARVETDAMRQAEVEARAREGAARSYHRRYGRHR